MKRWQVFFEFLIAIWLVISPFALGYLEIDQAFVTAIILGSLVLLASQLGIAKEQAWSEWLSFLLAVGLGLSPWLLGYAHASAPTVNAVVCSAGLLMLSLNSMISSYREDRYLHHNPAQHQG